MESENIEGVLNISALTLDVCVLVLYLNKWVVTPFNINAVQVEEIYVELLLGGIC